MQDVLLELILPKECTVDRTLARAGFDYMFCQMINRTYRFQAKDAFRLRLESFCQHANPLPVAVAMHPGLMSLPIGRVLE